MLGGSILFSHLWVRGQKCLHRALLLERVCRLLFFPQFLSYRYLVLCRASRLDPFHIYGRSENRFWVITSLVSHLGLRPRIIHAFLSFSSTGCTASSTLLVALAYLLAPLLIRSFLLMCPLILPLSGGSVHPSEYLHIFLS